MAPGVHTQQAMRAPALLLSTLFVVTGCASRPAPAPATSAYTPEYLPTAEEREMLSAQLQLTSSVATGLRVGAAMLQLTVDRCPNASEIVRAGLLSPGLDDRDLWGTPYLITCPSTGGPVVTSAGPDLRFGTKDDVVTAN